MQRLGGRKVWRLYKSRLGCPARSGHKGLLLGWKEENRVRKLAALVLVVAGLFIVAASARGDEVEVTLYAGQDIDVGTVTVSNDATNLYVEYSTTGGWLLGETHLAVATSLSGIPQTKTGNPKVGKFDHQMEHDPPVTDYTYTISLADAGYDPGDALVIAAHAEVLQPESMTIVSGDGQTIVTQRRSGNAIGFTAVNAPAVHAWEPGPLYPNDGPDDSAWEANSLWDQNLSNPSILATGADWIWESYRVQDPIYGTVLALQRTFNIGLPIAGNLLIACDNGYEVFLNGTSLGSDNVYGVWRTSALMQANVDVSGWQAVGSYSAQPHLQQGTNTLTIDVANEYYNPPDYNNSVPGTISNNPAGCIFALEISYYVEETAWGNGTGFPGANWATYFNYTVQAP